MLKILSRCPLLRRSEAFFNRTWAGWISGFLGLALPPIWLDDFTLFQLTLAGIYAIAILGLNLLLGFNGQFSLGHSAFYALGAYATALLVGRWDLSAYLAIPASGIICLLAGFLFGLPALRLEGIYLALATFALAVATPQLLKSSYLEAWTGGVQGLSLSKPGAPFDLPVSSDQWWYGVTLLVVIGLFWLARNLVNSRSGRALVAIRDNPVAAQAMGINIAAYKTHIFALSALYAGIAGALAAIVLEYIAPDSFSFALSLLFLIGLVIGGLGSLGGSLFGGLFILYVPNIAEQFSKGLAGAMFGLLLIVVMYVMPSGAAGLYHTLIQRWRKK